MKMTAFRSMLLTAAALIAVTGSLHAAPGDVKASFDAPCRYPSGLATDGRHFYVADWREAVIHQVRCDDGELVRSFVAPTLMPHGLTWADGLLYVSDDHTGWVYALDPIPWERVCYFLFDVVETLQAKMARLESGEGLSRRR